METMKLARVPEVGEEDFGTHSLMLAWVSPHYGNPYAFVFSV
jgi:hypothetical protein